MDFHVANLEVTHDEDDVILRIRSIPELQKAYKKKVTIYYKKSWLSHVTSDLAAKITTSCTWSEIFFLFQASHCQELLQTDAGKQAAVILPCFA